MEVRSSAHPASDILAALGQGKLDDDAVKPVLAHLDDCDECR
jgi:hypothetical protein